MTDIRETNPSRLQNPTEAIITIEGESLSRTPQDFLTCGEKKNNEVKVGFTGMQEKSTAKDFSGSLNGGCRMLDFVEFRAGQKQPMATYPFTEAI